MKKLTRRQFTAAGILAALGAAAAFIPSCNTPTCVYGPPPEDYEPDENVVETVYGPPEDYDPADNEPVEVYGPPEDFDVTINEPECLYGPPEDYEPADNELVDVYGPPEDD